METLDKTVQKIHDMMGALLRRTAEVGNEEETETEIAQFVNLVNKLRGQLFAQMSALSKATTSGLHAIEAANIKRLLDRCSSSSSQ